MRGVMAAVTLGTLWLAMPARGADEYRLETLDEAAAADELSSAVAETLAPQGVSVLKGKRTMCRLWLVQQWSAADDFTASDTVLYPFAMGQLMGAAHYQSTAEDFRGQEIAPGWYTVRYAQQPVDGNHIGTSETRDFLLLCPAAEDTSPEPLEPERLIELSKQAAASTHPCMLSLLRAAADGPAAPSLSHDEDRELWSARLAGRTAQQELVIEVVLVGRAPE